MLYDYLLVIQSPVTMLDIKTSTEYFARTGSLTNFSMLLAGKIQVSVVGFIYLGAEVFEGVHCVPTSPPRRNFDP